MLDVSQIARPTDETGSFIGKILLFCGMAMIIIFFLPWALINDEMFFSWDFVERTDESEPFFIIFILIAGITSIVLGLLPQVPVLFRAISMFIVGFIPMAFAYSGIMDMGGLRGVSGIGTGGIIAFSMLLISFGTVYWSTKHDSILARVLVGLGMLFCLLAFLVPVETQFHGDLMPIAAIFKQFANVDDEPMMVVLLIYSLLPIYLAFSAMVVLPPVDGEYIPAGRISYARFIGFFAVAYVPGFFVIASMVIWMDEVPIFFLLYFAVVIASYLIYIISGAGVIVSRVAKAVDNIGLNQPTTYPVAQPVSQPLAGQPQPDIQQQPIANAVPVARSETFVENLELRMTRLNSIYEKGFITEQEYNEKRQELLATI